jgi:hypothetical protein
VFLVLREIIIKDCMLRWRIEERREKREERRGKKRGDLGIRIKKPSKIDK